MFDRNRLQELKETWINGNRKDVVKEIISKDSAEAALWAAYFCYCLNNDIDRSVFCRLLESAAN